MSSLSLAQAQTIISGALHAARQKNYKPMGVVVVDTAAQAIAFAREDGASALRLDIAHGKAGAAIGMASTKFIYWVNREIKNKKKLKAQGF